MLSLLLLLNFLLNLMHFESISFRFLYFPLSGVNFISFSFISFTQLYFIFLFHFFRSYFFSSHFISFLFNLILYYLRAISDRQLVYQSLFCL